MSSRQQFTARQILDAGLRAESMGQLDHASQFFNFVLENHASSSEADAARDHLRRLSLRTAEPRTEPQRAERRAFPAVAPHDAGPGPALRDLPSPALSAPPAGAAYLNGQGPNSWVDAGLSPFASPRALDSQGAPAAAIGAPALIAAPLASAPPHLAEAPRPSTPLDPRTVFPPLGGPTAPPLPAAAGPSPGAPAPMSAATVPSTIRLSLPHLHLPPPKRGYRFGRFMAGALTGLGSLAIAAGTGILVVTIMRGSAPEAVVGEMLKNPAGPQTTGFWIIVGGLATAFAGQSARALFDSANANREFVHILRAIIDPHEDERPRR